MNNKYYLKILLWKTISKIMVFLCFLLYSIFVFYNLIALISLSICSAYAVVCLTALIVYFYKQNLSKKIFWMFCLPIMPFKTVFTWIEGKKTLTNNGYYLSQIKTTLGTGFVLVIGIGISFISSNYDFSKIIFLIINGLFFGLTLLMLILFLAKWQDQKTKVENIEDITIDQKLITEILDLLSKHNGVLTYKEINQEFQISLADLNKITLYKFQKNFKQYSLFLKMNFAKSLYEQGYETSKIAEQCGYQSKSSFLKAYKSFCE